VTWSTMVVPVSSPHNRQKHSSEQWHGLLTTKSSAHGSVRRVVSWCHVRSTSKLHNDAIASCIDDSWRGY